MTGTDGETAKTITVSIIENDQVVRESLRLLLEGAHGLRCVAAYASGAEALLAMPVVGSDVLLLGNELPALNGAVCVAQLKACAPQTQILVLATFETAPSIFEMVCAGASGYLPKTTPHQELAQAVQWVYAGGSPMSMPMARKVAAVFQNSENLAARSGSLTELEEGIVTSLARGSAYKEVADKYDLSVPALLTQLRGVYQKLHAYSRVT